MTSTPTSRVVSFALPFDVTCGLCKRVHLCGTSSSASKTVAGVSPNGVVVWHFALTCISPCTGKLEFESDSAVDSRFVLHGQTVEPAPALENVSRSDGGSKPFRRGDNTIGDTLRKLANGSSELAALQAQRAWAHSDVAATADLMLARHAARWDATPSRRVARESVRDEALRRADARRVWRRVKKTVAVAPFSSQRARAGRMSRSHYSVARNAVRSLHRGGALVRIVASLRSGNDSKRDLA
jgi:hypothetical protein